MDELYLICRFPCSLCRRHCLRSNPKMTKICTRDYILHQETTLHPRSDYHYFSQIDQRKPSFTQIMVLLFLLSLPMSLMKLDMLYSKTEASPRWVFAASFNFSLWTYTLVKKNSPGYLNVATS